MRKKYFLISFENWYLRRCSPPRSEHFEYPSAMIFVGVASTVALMSVYQQSSCQMVCPFGKWELMRSERKADEDYKNREKDASKDVTFVFVTPHVWNQKDRWIEDRKKEGK